MLFLLKGIKYKRTKNMKKIFLTLALIGLSSSAFAGAARTGTRSRHRTRDADGGAADRGGRTGPALHHAQFRARDQ